MMKEIILNAADDVAEAISETVSEMAEEVSEAGASGASTWDIIKGYVVEYGLRLLIALVVLFVGLKLINVLVKRIKTRKALKNMDNSAATMLGSFLGIALKVILFVTVIGILGIPMTSVITIIGTVSLAIGLALQGSLANFAGGLMIIIFKPFRLGDFIVNHTDSGVVTDMGVFYTTLTTPDNRVITVPNSLLSNATVVNYSVSETRRVDLDIAVAYDTDTDIAKRLLLSLGKANPLSLEEPEPFCAVTKHGESAVMLTLRVWCKSADYWNLRFELLENIKKAFEAAGIEIPYNYVNVIEKRK